MSLFDYILTIIGWYTLAAVTFIALFAISGQEYPMWAAIMVGLAIPMIVRPTRD